MDRCDDECASADSDALNRRCACEVLDTGSLLSADPRMNASLFSRSALFVDRTALNAMSRVSTVVFEVAGNPYYAEHVLRWAPAIAQHIPGSSGGVLGLDFHLTVEGPRLIEINTNPGGLLLNAMVLDAVQSCAPAVWAPWTSTAKAREAAVSVWLDDAREQSGRTVNRIAIVDVMPREQFLYPEFELFAHAFRERGVDAVIRAPEELSLDADRLYDAEGRIDAVYNRLTDFALADPTSAPLADAYLQRAIALTPHPRAHALFADKRNLAVLGDAPRLESWGIDAASAWWLEQAIPPTVEVRPDNRSALWADRKRYFFKPASGFGSRGSYRGDKLTRRVWGSMASAPYVAQAFAPPSMRLLQDGTSLKADVRCYVARSGVLLFAARLYQGQTTNMRTSGGGFAAVLTNA